jgi:hypothetical protein
LRRSLSRRSLRNFRQRVNRWINPLAARLAAKQAFHQGRIFVHEITMRAGEFHRRFFATMAAPAQQKTSARLSRPASWFNRLARNFIFPARLRESPGRLFCDLV